MSTWDARPEVHLLVTDLDNTLWDWFTIWFQSFSALLDGVSRTSGLPTATLESEIRQVHQRRGTSEYSYLLRELPSLRRLHQGRDVLDIYDDAIHAYRSARKRSTQLYPGVLEALTAIRAAGVRVVAYTESLSFHSSRRIRDLGLDGVINVLYSSPDHDFPDGVSLEDLRSEPPDSYGLRSTFHRYVPRGHLKPDPSILTSIMTSMEVDPQHTVYVGDSLMKDVAMAQAVGAIDVLAAYGAADHQDGYKLLRRVSHWTEADVRREQEINAAPPLSPSYTLEHRFDELLDYFNFCGKP
jgi:FMN phosphatase YigB (HAD superfamily)